MNDREINVLTFITVIAILGGVPGIISIFKWWFK